MTTTSRHLRPRLAFFLIVFVLLALGASYHGWTGARAYRYYRVGNPLGIVTTTRPGLVLEGGGIDIEESFEWMIDRSGGGDFLVIRASGTDAYNQCIHEMWGLGGKQANSVATLIIPSRAAAYDPFVIKTIRNAEALWLAGGDQADYVNFWKGTPVEDAIHHIVAKGAPIGGTSSGLSILGEFFYSAESDESVADELMSSHALNDPFDRRMNLRRDFLDLPHMRGVLVDGHLVQRDRMGRMIAFLSRIAEHAWVDEVKGIGIERETALLIEPDGKTRVISRRNFPGPAAYFFRMTQRPERCVNGKSLIVHDVRVDKVTPSGTFDLRTWTAVAGLPFSLSVENGKIRSSASGGAIYP